MAPGPQALRLIRLSIDQVSRSEGPHITCTFLDKTNQRRPPIKPSRKKPAKPSGKADLEDEIESDDYDSGVDANTTSSLKAAREGHSIRIGAKGIDDPSNDTLRHQSFPSIQADDKNRGKGRSGRRISSEDDESDSDSWKFTLSSKRKPSDKVQNPRKKSRSATTLRSTEIVVLSSE